MSEPYPLPSYAVSAYMASTDHIAIALTDGPEGRGHTVLIPADERGMKLLVDILRHRQQASRPTIGQRSSPVRYDIEQMLKSMASAPKAHAYGPKGRPKAPLSLGFDEED